MSAVKTDSWACGTCGHQYLCERTDGTYNDEAAKALAERCCVCFGCGSHLAALLPKDLPCYGAVRRCGPCKRKDALETQERRYKSYLELKAVPFDKGAFADDDDRFYQSEDEILERVVESLEDDGIEKPAKEQVRAALERWMLVPAVSQSPRSFDIRDFLHDEAPEEWDADNYPDLIAAVDALNEVLAKVTSQWLEPSTTERIDVESIMECWTC